MKFKSRIIHKKDIDWDCELLINALAFEFDEEGKAIYIEDLKAYNPRLTDEELEKACCIETIGRNLHMIAMETVVTYYTAEYHEEDILAVMEELRKEEEELSKAGGIVKKSTDEELRERAKHLILQSLVYEDLAKRWNIVVEDFQIFLFLKVIYGGRLGHDVSKYLDDPKEFAKVKQKILASEVGKRLRRSFKFRVTVPKYKKYEKEIQKAFSLIDPTFKEDRSRTKTKTKSKRKLYN